MTHVTFKTNFKVKNRSNYYVIKSWEVEWGNSGFMRSREVKWCQIRNLLQTCVSDLDLEIEMVYLKHEVVLLPSSRFCHQANFSEIWSHLRVISRSFWGHFRSRLRTFMVKNIFSYFTMAIIHNFLIIFSI